MELFLTRKPAKPGNSQLSQLYVIAASYIL